METIWKLKERILKKRALKTTYVNIKGIIILMAVYFLRKKISFKDNYFYTKLIGYSIMILILMPIMHHLLMKLIYHNDDNK